MGSWCVTRRAALALIAAAAAVAVAVTPSASALEVPVGSIHGVAQTFEPGVLLPTVFPKSITKVDVGAASGIGSGPAPAHLLVYHAGPREAFQLGIWRGDRRAAVVKGLLTHDGAHGSTRPFRAGRFAGTLELQRGVASKPRLVASYVWRGAGYTYMLVLVETPGGTPLFAGLNPLQTIASFRV